jgi:hypothetical protein
MRRGGRCSHRNRSAVGGRNRRCLNRRFNLSGRRGNNGRSRCGRCGGWCGRSCGRSYRDRRLFWRAIFAYGGRFGHNYACGWCNNHYGARRNCRCCRSLCNHRPCWRPRCDCRRRGWRRNNGRSRARLRNNHPASFSGRRRRNRLCRRCGRCNGRGCLHDRRSSCGPGRQVRVTRFFLFFFLLGQNGLHHIAGLGDVGQVNLGSDRLRAARGCSARVCRRPRSTLEMRANLIRFIPFDRAGVGFARRHAQSWKDVENRARLYFQLFREIVDSNLTHPPLFKSSAAKTLVAHRILMALEMAAGETCLLIPESERSAQVARTPRRPPHSVSSC